MLVAINYSAPAAAFLRSGTITVDRLKCPAWPSLIKQARRASPVYVHFPLSIGWGIRDAFNTETRAPADWHIVETLLRQTDTPFVNLHLAPETSSYPDIPLRSQDPAHRDFFVERFIEDIEPVIRRFGAERVIVENVYEHGGAHCHAALHPDVIRTVVRETGCGFLIDLSHARIAAHEIGMARQDYLDGLPVEAIREIHVTGIQAIDEGWMTRMRGAGVEEATLARFAGRWTDHQAMGDEDWAFLTWALERIRVSAWGRPWCVVFEYGGLGRVWEALTDAARIAAQVPRLSALVYQYFEDPMTTDTPSRKEETGGCDAEPDHSHTA